MDIRDNVAEIVKERACVKAEIARRIGMTPVKFGAVLAKKRKLDANEFVSVCEAISMTPDAVLNYRVNVPESGTNQ